MGGESASNERERIVSLYRELGPAVYRRCLRLLEDREAARDAAREVFVKLVRDVERLADRETALPWIYRVATNHCLEVLRGARRRGVNATEDALDVVPDAARFLPDRLVARKVPSRFDPRSQAIAGAPGIPQRAVHRKLTRLLDRARARVGRSEP